MTLNTYRILMVLCLSVLCMLPAAAQQAVKGTITDKTSEKPIQGATITITGNSAAALSDASGRFNLPNVPVGRHTLAVSAVGYKTIAIPELLVTAGKEVILDISLEQEIKALTGIVLQSGRARKGAAANEYAVASSRSFNPEEVTRFAGGRNDPSRLVSNFAGVIANNDSRNDIIVRGNSPAGILWRIEGIPVPNPNHFGTLGATGGPVSALNTNALRSSDFFIGAFPAEFGNATAAVFDIGLRTGNSDRHERTLQLNVFSGLEATFEGPLGKAGKGASYLVGYRYSFAQIASSLGLNLGTSAIPRYQDWVVNINLPKGKAGKLNFFGLGGVSRIDFEGRSIDTTDFYSRKDQDAYPRTNFYIAGARHTIDISPKSYIRTVLSVAGNQSRLIQYQYAMPLDYSRRWQITDGHDRGTTLRLSSYLNTKIDAKTSLRAGVLAEGQDLRSKVADREGLPESAPYRVIRDLDERTLLLQYFAQARYKPTDKWSFTAGLHAMNFTLNNSFLLEPRASASYQLNPKSSIYASYGLHGQQQPLPVYFYQQALPNESIDRRNRNLDFTKAHHYIIGYENRFAPNWRVKTEAYLQQLFDVPVEQIPSGFSLLNAGNDFFFPEKSGLVNRGTGRNRGIELTLERFLSKSFYLMTTASVFNSTYKGSDGMERNTAFNFGHVANMLAGREWPIGKSGKNVFTTDIRLTSIGGRYATPVDVTASVAAGREVLDETRYNELRLAPYFRLDTKFGVRLNSTKRRISHSLYLDLQNLTNRQNIFLRRFNALSGTTGDVYQIGFFPDFLYRVNF